jgi:hypothetical protein
MAYVVRGRDAFEDGCAYTKVLAWTREKPTKPGSYWLRNARRTRFPSMDIREGESFVIEVNSELLVIFPGDDRTESVEDIGGEFSGPIEPPV